MYKNINHLKIQHTIYRTIKLKNTNKYKTLLIIERRYIDMDTSTQI